MVKERKQKLILRLRYRDVLQVAQLLGSACRTKWWFEVWLKHFRSQLSDEEYRRLMAAVGDQEALAQQGAGEQQ